VTFDVIATNLMSNQETTNRSYLLRLWRSEETGFVWRAMLENVTEPGERRYFKDIKSLTTYLLTQHEDKPPQAEGDK
jgi:hypothetical protein